MTTTTRAVDLRSLLTAQVLLTILLSLGAPALLAAPGGLAAPKSNSPGANRIADESRAVSPAGPPELDLLEYLGELQQDDDGWYGPEEVDEQTEMSNKSIESRSAMPGEGHRR